MKAPKFKCCSRENVNKSKETANESVPFLKLFRFISNTDTILLVVSVSACLITGVCHPIMMILFGDLAQVFVDSNNHQGHDSLDVAKRTQCQNYSSLNSTTLFVKYRRTHYFESNSSSVQYFLIYSVL